MRRRLKRDFFRRHPKKVAPQLLGYFLVAKINGKEFVGKIVETEAYGGYEDKACHVGRFGFTKRTAPLFGEVGYSYVYSVYINTYCLNVVAHEDKEAGGILIRALQPIKGVECVLDNLKKTSNFNIKNLLNGPGKICRALNIDKSFNGKDMIEGKDLFIIRGEEIENKDIVATPRINIPYAGISKRWHWRFLIKDSPFVSKPPSK